MRRHGLRFAQGGGCGCGRGSDIRLKRDIAQVGEHNGINLYRFRYLWSDTTYVGVTAQEVAAVKPDAVSRGADGYLRVHTVSPGLISSPPFTGRIFMTPFSMVMLWSSHSVLASLETQLNRSGAEPLFVTVM
jgi:hypothetical protein